MPKGIPVKPEVREAILEDIRQNADLPIGQQHTRNSIARRHGVSGATVGNIAQTVGYVFDWAATEAATAAARVKSDALRENIANLMLLEAHRALSALHEPVERWEFSHGTDERAPRWSSRILPEPSIGDQRNLMVIAGIGVTKAAEVSRPQAGQGAEQGAAMLQGIAASLDAAASAILASGVDPTDVPEG